MEYILPEKELLEKNSLEIQNDKKYYNLSKLIYKKNNDRKLLFPIGIDQDKEKYYIDLYDKTSMFIVGETGSGKSVFLNSIIISLLMKNKPSDLQFIFIDPRNVELSSYNNIPHLYRHSISSIDESINALKYIMDIMEGRKKIFNDKKVEDIEKYNEISYEKLPQIILIIDEAMDILCSEKTENMINRLLPDGYKFGIHLIISTSSYIKNGFALSSMKLFDYIITFDLASKEQANFIKIHNANLLSVYGEALVKCNGNKIIDIQTPYVSEHDIKEVTDFIKNQNYINNI